MIDTLSFKARAIIEAGANRAIAKLSIDNGERIAFETVDYELAQILRCEKSSRPSKLLTDSKYLYSSRPFQVKSLGDKVKKENSKIFRDEFEGVIKGLENEYNVRPDNLHL